MILRNTIFGKTKPKNIKLFNQNKGQKEMVNAFINGLLSKGVPPISFNEIIAVTKTSFRILESIKDEADKLRYKVISSFLALKDYCESEKFKGWDPYDGLNSKVVLIIAAKNWDLARLVWIQALKRSPINFRKLLLVPKQFNSKGIALFLSGYCNIYNLVMKR